METALNTKSLFISVIGRPNVGKSSLVNMMVNSKVSIVSPKPQTTRNKVLGILTQNDTQFVFIDTPGMHRPRNRLGDYMLSEVNHSFLDVDVCLHVVEHGYNIGQIEEKIIKKFKELNIPVLLIINKIDRLSDKSVLVEDIKKATEIFDYVAVVPLSAKTGDGKNLLLGELNKIAKPSAFFYDTDDITDQTERMLVSEIIREKLLMFLDKELPHGVAVFVEKFVENVEKFADIDAVIYCERSNHKGIIIGAGGQMLKKVGTAARLELENILGRKINLNLWVKVKENWRNKTSVLSMLGYSQQ